MVLPPRLLLLDVAGPLEVLRRANVEQRRWRGRLSRWRSRGTSSCICGVAAPIRSFRPGSKGAIICTRLCTAPRTPSPQPRRGWSLASLADEAAVGPRHLSRLFRAHSGMSVVDYVARMRVALARELLAGSRLDIESVAERSGFGSARQFRRAWNRLHSQPPSRMRAG